MDKISIVGLALGIATILVGQVLEGGHMSSLVQPTAFLIVIGGTLGAVMLQSPLPTFITGLEDGQMGICAARDPTGTVDRAGFELEPCGAQGRLARTRGADVDGAADPFMRKGLQHLVVAFSPNRWRSWSESMSCVERVELRREWESAGGYSPTIATIIGAVMGLIHVDENLSDAAPSLAPASPWLSLPRFTGSVQANLIFLPIAKKLLANISRLVAMRRDVRRWVGRHCERG